MTQRVLLLSAGSGVAAYGYLLTVAADLGNGPLFAVQDGLRVWIDMSLATSATAVGLALVAVAFALRAPLGVGTLVMPIATGLWISMLEPFVVAWDGIAARWIQFVGGTAVMMLGAVLAVSASLGVAAIDGVMFGVAQRIGVTPARARFGMEVSLAAMGAALGGSVGAGTIVMGATVGHLFQGWSNVLERLGDVKHLQLDAVRADRPARSDLPGFERRVARSAIGSRSQAARVAQNSVKAST